MNLSSFPHLLSNTLLAKDENLVSIWPFEFRNRNPEDSSNVSKPLTTSFPLAPEFDS